MCQTTVGECPWTNEKLVRRSLPIFQTKIGTFWQASVDEFEKGYKMWPNSGDVEQVGRERSYVIDDTPQSYWPATAGAVFWNC